jgi:anti-anti-sigma regulatory factor
VAEAWQAFEARRVSRIGYLVFAKGELDASAAEGLARLVGRLVDAGAREVVVDLSQAQTVGTAAVDSVDAVARRLDRLGGELLLAARHHGRRDYVLRKVEADDFGSMLGVHPLLDDAIRRRSELADGALR